MINDLFVGCFFFPFFLSEFFPLSFYRSSARRENVKCVDGRNNFFLYLFSFFEQTHENG